eukprot:2692877-Pyramimonas_sp.AAC.1
MLRDIVLYFTRPPLPPLVERGHAGASNSVGEDFALHLRRPPALLLDTGRQQQEPRLLRRGARV